MAETEKTFTMDELDKAVRIAFKHFLKAGAEDDSGHAGAKTALGLALLTFSSDIRYTLKEMKEEE